MINTSYIKLFIISVVLVFISWNSFSQNSTSSSAYQIEENGRIIHPVESSVGIIFTDNYASSIYKIENNSAVKILEYPNCGKYFSISSNGNLIGYKYISETGLQAPAVFNLLTNKTKLLHPLVDKCGQPVFYGNNSITYTIDNILFINNNKYDLGSYSNIISVCKNGSSIAYSDDTQQIFIFDTNSETSIKITDNATAFLYPKWSPDGGKLSYSSIDGRLFIYHIKTKNTFALGYGGNVNWLCNSEQIIFERSYTIDIQLNGSDLYVADVRGRNIKKLKTSLNINECQATITTNNKVIFSSINKRKVFSANIDTLTNSLQEIRLLFSHPYPLPITFYETINFTKGRNLVDLGEMPYVHQVYDTPNFHDGAGSCGPTTAIMAITSFNILPKWPTEIDKIYLHWNNYGSYVADRYHINESYFDTYTSPYGSESWGAYSYMWANESPSSTMKSFYQKHGLESSQLWTTNCTFDYTKNEIDNGFPHTICNYMTVAGHIILAKGYLEGQHTLLFHDPFGDKNTPDYPSYDGQNVFYDWPGYNNGYQNLDADGTHGGVAWTVTTHGYEPEYNDTIIDDNAFGNGFYMFNQPPSHQRFYRDQLDGYNGHSWWTSTINDSGDVCYVTWEPNLQDSGMYEITAFIPANFANAESCIYRVHYSGIDTNIVINQSNFSDEWVILGYFPLHPNDSCSVYLGDNTGVYGQYLAYDAICFSREFLVEINNSISFTKLNVYPNPTKDKFNVTLPICNKNESQLIITSVTGKTIQTLNIPQGLTELSLSAYEIKLSTGNYFIIHKCDNKIFTKKLTIFK